VSLLPTLETQTDYDLFDYEDSDQPLSLEEAISRASRLRSLDKSRVYRVVPVDTSQTGFRVKAVSREEIQADFFARLYTWISRRLTASFGSH
jgi:hypothetical protein